MATKNVMTRMTAYAPIKTPVIDNPSQSSEPRSSLLSNSCSAVFNRITLLTSHHMTVDSQRNPWVTVT